MQKRKPSLERSLGPVKLYLNNIRDIVTSLQELPNNPEITITIDDYEFSSPEDIPNMPEKNANNLYISCIIISSYTHFSVRVTKDWTQLRCTENTPLTRGVFSEIESILSSHQRRGSWIGSFFYFVSGLGFSTLFLLLQGQVLQNQILIYTAYVVFAVIFVSMVLHLATLSVRRTKIVLSEQHEQLSFWQRNKDQLIINIAVAIVTAILTLIATLIAQSQLP